MERQFWRLVDSSASLSDGWSQLYIRTFLAVRQLIRVFIEVDKGFQYYFDIITSN